MTGLLIGHIYITEQSRKAPEVALALFWTSKLDILHLKKKNKKCSEGKQCLLACSFFQACEDNSTQPPTPEVSQGAASSSAGSRKQGIRGSPYSSLNVHTDFKKSSCRQPILTEGPVFSSSIRPAQANAQDCFERPINPCGLHHKAFSYKEGGRWPV